MSQSGVTEVVNALIARGQLRCRAVDRPFRPDAGTGHADGHQCQRPVPGDRRSGPQHPGLRCQRVQLHWLATGGQQSPTVPAWETAMMNALPTLQQGAQDRPGQVFFVRRVQALANVIGSVNSLRPPRTSPRTECSGRQPLRRSRRCSNCSASPRTASSDRRPERASHRVRPVRACSRRTRDRGRPRCCWQERASGWCAGHGLRIAACRPTAGQVASGVGSSCRTSARVRRRHRRSVLRGAWQLPQPPRLVHGLLPSPPLSALAGHAVRHTVTILR